MAPSADGSSVTATCPCLSVAACTDGDMDAESMQFCGVQYIKCPSLAWCMEWVMTAALRESG